MVAYREQPAVNHNWRYSPGFVVANEFLHAVKFLQVSTFLILIGKRIPPSTCNRIRDGRRGGGPSGLAISHQLKFSKMFIFFQYFQ
jgi:hypothetical protein